MSQRLLNTGSNGVEETPLQIVATSVTLRLVAAGMHFMVHLYVRGTNCRQNWYYTNIGYRNPAQKIERAQQCMNLALPPTVWILATEQKQLAHDLF
jgi:hypothetical protein